MNSHESGLAADFSRGDEKGRPPNAVDALQIALANFGGVVAYSTFYHADGRKGPVYTINMTHVQLASKVKDGSSFEFSKVRQIAAGHLRKDSSKNYLAAWVGDEIYVYRNKRNIGSRFAGQEALGGESCSEFQGTHSWTGTTLRDGINNDSSHRCQLNCGSRWPLVALIVGAKSPFH
jgi:hypothetical protein